MRIDKYLWAVRFYKSRNEASIACKKGHVRIDEMTVKPSREIFGSEKILLRKNQMDFTLLVLGIPNSRVGPKLVSEYIKETTSISELEKLEQYELVNRQNKSLGIKGRPTKKDRRNLGKWFD